MILLTASKPEEEEEVALVETIENDELNGEWTKAFQDILII